METFKTFLQEANLSRIFTHLQNRNVGVITAFRGRYALPENRTRNKKLFNDIKAAGFGIIHAYGHYIEGHGSDQARDTNEEVFFVIGDTGSDSGKLKGFLKKAGEKYNQDSVLYKEFGTPDAVLIGTSSEDEDGNPVEFPGKGNSATLGPWNPMTLGMFYTRLRGHGKNKTFVFDKLIQEQSLFGKWATWACNKLSV